VDEKDEDDDLEEDEADEGFMEKWRKSRLQELTNGGQRTSTLHQNSQRRAMYGDMKAVDGEGYLDAVERSAPDTVVVVYIYDEYVSLKRTAGYGNALTERYSRMLASCSRTVSALSHASTRRLVS
jgi:hypothetical protein